MFTREQLCEDKRFQDLPFKIDTNARGQILMSPTSLYQGRNAHRIARLQLITPAASAAVGRLNRMHSLPVGR
ncbi:hypothetical protein EI77_02852 [Prosthecobacter fusiformis]|uniref:Uncharacterized protein n=1 Tax=Prosthecobacter fusiformis TaxID=48464 RepID=A0A4V3FFH0_9BACT|nr:hypothetical protein EI77_02852 [Prosthecobacter fusiformis]